MRKIAIIPARGDSKRIPRKNIKDFLGKPIIAYSIETAIQSGLFDEVMVSTDDEEIAKIAVQYGATVPFMRSKKNADDYAGTSEVILEVLSNYEISNKSFDVICCIYPTAPLLKVKKFKDSYQMFINGGFDSFFCVIPFNYPIQRALVANNNKIKMINPENYKYRSQDLEKTYHDAGQFYWLRSNKFLDEQKLFL